MFEMFNEKDEGEAVSEAMSSQSTEEQATGYSSSPSSDQSPFSQYSAPAKEIFVVSVGGSVFINEKPNAALIAKFGETISSLHREGYRFALVIGGGKIGRSYIAAAKGIGATNYAMDEIGIALTRVNARLLIESIESSHKEVLTKVSDAKAIIDSGKIPVYGGLLPGITTDAVSALLAESLSATFVNLSNVDGIYSSDPKDNPRAKFYPSLSHSRLLSLLQVAESKPGQNIVLDIPAGLVLKRSSIHSIFLDGNNLSNFESAIRGGEFNGTVVSIESELTDEA